MTSQPSAHTRPVTQGSVRVHPRRLTRSLLSHSGLRSASPPSARTFRPFPLESVRAGHSYGSAGLCAPAFELALRDELVVRDGVLMLASDYNIRIVTALYLVDRAKDRKDLPEEKIGLAHPAVENVEV